MSTLKKFFNREINDISSQKDLKIDLTKISNNLKDHWIMLKDNEKKEFIKNFINYSCNEKSKTMAT